MFQKHNPCTLYLLYLSLLYGDKPPPPPPHQEIFHVSKAASHWERKSLVSGLRVPAHMQQSRQVVGPWPRSQQGPFHSILKGVMMIDRLFEVHRSAEYGELPHDNVFAFQYEFLLFQGVS